MPSPAHIAAERGARHALAQAKGPSRQQAVIVTARSASVSGKIAVVRFDGASRDTRIYDLTGAAVGRRVYVDAQPGGSAVVAAIVV